MSRKMPKAGFYVLNPSTYGADHKGCIYTTGVPGGGGHKHCKSSFDPKLQKDDGKYWAWGRLLWSCVHTQERFDKDYTYYANYADIPASEGVPFLDVSTCVPKFKPKSTKPKDPKKSMNYRTVRDYIKEKGGKNVPDSEILAIVAVLNSKNGYGGFDPWFAAMDAVALKYP